MAVAAGSTSEGVTAGEDLEEARLLSSEIEAVPSSMYPKPRSAVEVRSAIILSSSFGCRLDALSERGSEGNCAMRLRRRDGNMV